MIAPFQDILQYTSRTFSVQGTTHNQARAHFRISRQSRRERPVARRKRTRRCAVDWKPQLPAMDSMATSGLHRSSSAFASRTALISSSTEWPSSALKRCSTRLRVQGNRAKTSLDDIPLQAFRRMNSRASSDTFGLNFGMGA